jgi:hypothetical protein
MDLCPLSSIEKSLTVDHKKNSRSEDLLPIATIALFKDALGTILSAASAHANENSKVPSIDKANPAPAWYVYSNYSSSKNTSFHPAPSDRLQFGFIWQVIQELVVQNKLNELIKDRRQEIKEKKEHWRPEIEKLQQDSLDGSFYQNFETILQTGRLIKVEEGAGAAYFLLDKNSIPYFVIKPIDEDIFCLNNRKFLGSPYNEELFHVRPNIPLYRSAQTDVLAFRIASLMGIAEITPETVMAIISNSEFYDLSDHLTAEELQDFIKDTGSIDREKLCSIQTFIPDSKELFEVIHEWLHANYSNDQIESFIDQNDFEDANLFIWSIYDNDAHGGNIRVYVKKTDEHGNKIYGIRKVDNGLSNPEKNRYLVNYLAYLPNAEKALSERAKAKIAQIPISEIAAEMRNFEMEACIDAFKERIEVLQILAKRKDITIAEINLRMSALELPDGKELALSYLPREEIEKIVYQSSSSVQIEQLTSNITLVEGAS